MEGQLLYQWWSPEKRNAWRCDRGRAGAQARTARGHGTQVIKRRSVARHKLGREGPAAQRVVLRRPNGLGPRVPRPDVGDVRTSALGACDEPGPASLRIAPAYDARRAERKAAPLVGRLGGAALCYCFLESRTEDAFTPGHQSTGPEPEVQRDVGVAGAYPTWAARSELCGSRTRGQAQQEQSERAGTAGAEREGRHNMSRRRCRRYRLKSSSRLKARMGVASSSSNARNARHIGVWGSPMMPPLLPQPRRSAEPHPAANDSQSQCVPTTRSPQRGPTDRPLAELAQPRARLFGKVHGARRVNEVQ